VPSIQLRSGGHAATETHDGLRPLAAGGMPSASTGARSRAHRLRRQARAYLFLLPSSLILLIFVVYPIAESFWMSLHNWSFFSSVQTFIGLQNYRTMVHDPRFWNALRVTAVYTVLVVPLQVGLGLALAVALQRNSFVNKFFRSLYFLPVIASLATMGIVWKFLLDPQIGIIPHLLSVFGLPNIDFLESTTWALPSVMLVGVWKGVGFSMVILLAALQEVPEAQIEAAVLDGAGPWSRFRRVVLPFLRPTLLFASIISTIASMQVFDSIYVMTLGGPIFHTETIVYYIYEAAFNYFQPGYGAAISWVLFVLILFLSMFQLRLFRYKEVD
jgi:multiple sugar transport system permease protein